MEKYKFIHCENQDNPAINLTTIRVVEKQRYYDDDVYLIRFKDRSNSNYVDWNYNNKEERDIEYSKVLAAICSQNISDIVSL